MKIIIPKGFLVGEAQDDFTGVTTFLCPRGAVGGADCRGGAPGTRETDLLRPEKMMDKVNAVFLAGGSAYGLAAADGIMRWMRERGYGYRTGKIRGLRYASKTGVGACTVKTAGVTLTAVVAVNALGDVFDPETGKIVAGAKANDGSFIDTEKHIVSGGLLKLFAGANTTVGCILTDARIDKVQANKLASAGHGGLSRAIRPVHTDFDGDTLFCLASGKKPVLNLLLLQTAAAYAVERAVVAAATEGAAYEVSYDESAEDGEE